MSNAILQEDTLGCYRLKPIDAPYRRYACQRGNPLACDVAKAIDLNNNRPVLDCSYCGFPSPLPDNTEIQGQEGTYRIEAWIGTPGMGRLYRAIALGRSQTVIIKEYLLPSLHFNAEEIRQRQQTFLQVAKLELADGREQDFRLLQILEAIADFKTGRCYLILASIGDNTTLRQRLQVGVFSENEVYQVLQQVLQSLKFLHYQTFRLPSEQIFAGLAHGNLSLDSLLISVKQNKLESPLELAQGYQSQNSLEDENFLIYLCDLNLWESLFLPPPLNSAIGSPEDDLRALGWVAFFLLAANIAQESELDPRNNQHWPPINSLIRSFILRLMRIDQPFESAEEALEHLYHLPQPATPLPLEPLPSTSVQLPRKLWLNPWLIGLLSGLLMIGLLGGLISFLLARRDPRLVVPQKTLCCLKEVAGVSQGSFTYTASQNGTWHSILQQKDLMRQGETLDGQLKLAYPQLNLKLTTTTSSHDAIENVRLGRAAFAIAPLLHTLPEDLESQTIAYDGLAILVAFSYTKREQSLPKLLQGHISLAQLTEIYTSKVDNWQTFTGSPLSLQRYAPQNNELLEVFNLRIVDQGFIAVNPLPESEMMRTIIRDFELRNTGSIGFASLSKIIGQCSVYPLAFPPKGQAPVQVLRFKDGNTISPATDLCSKKGSYALAPQLLRTGHYPLAYPIAVIYPRDNDRPQVGVKVAEMLKTQEGQNLLAATGLIPLGLPK